MTRRFDTIPCLNTQLPGRHVRSRSPSVVLDVFLQQDIQRDFLIRLRNPSRVSWYMKGTWELKYVLVLYNAQLFERGPLIDNWVREVPFDTSRVCKRSFYIPMIRGGTMQTVDCSVGMKRQLLCLKMPEHVSTLSLKFL